MLSAVFRQHHDAPDFGDALADCEPTASGHRVDIVQRKDVVAVFAVMRIDFGFERNLVLVHHRGDTHVVGARAFTFLCDPDDLHLRPSYSSSSKTPMSFMAPFQVSLFSKPSRLPPP